MAMQVASKMLFVQCLVSYALVAAGTDVSAQQYASPTATTERLDTGDPSPAELDELFPGEMTHWRNQNEHVARGLIEGEALRLKILSKDSYVHRICDAVAELQQRAQVPLESRKPITGFRMTVERLRAQLMGGERISAESFDEFTGRWFGRWGNDEVNHDWQPTLKFETPQQFDNSVLQVGALQYAWISNGFGWNYLVVPPTAQRDKLRQSYVLGMVYYFDGVDFRTIRGEKAHVGFVDGPTRLVWITAQEVFLEEVFASDDPRNTVYAITALYHNLLDEDPSIAERATQAVYTRSPLSRPAFFEFQWR